MGGWRYIPPTGHDIALSQLRVEGELDRWAGGPAVTNVTFSLLIRQNYHFAVCRVMHSDVQGGRRLCLIALTWGRIDDMTIMTMMGSIGIHP